MKKEKGFSTTSIHNPDREQVHSQSLPLYLTSSFGFGNIEEAIDIFTGKNQGYVYSRYANPTIKSVESKISRLEVHGSDIEAFAIMTSSGMSAIHTLLSTLLKPGDKILTQGNLYGGTTELLKKILGQMEIRTEFIKLHEVDELSARLSSDPDIKLVYLESPANPTLDCIDIRSVASCCQDHNVISVIDNTFCTPYLQQPLLLGIDYCIHSTTKYMNGHGTGTAGVIVGKSELNSFQSIWQTMKLMGTNCSPFEAWLVNNGLKTLSLRMDKHCQNAMALAEFLEGHPAILKVNYPGLESFSDHMIAKKQMKDFGGMLSFTVDADLSSTLRVMNQFQLCSMAPTLGDTDTLVLHPTTSSHLNVDPALRTEFGISDNMIRVSVGIEDIEDIIEDFKQALDVIQK